MGCDGGGGKMGEEEADKEIEIRWRVVGALLFAIFW